MNADTRSLYHYKRPRLHQLFREAVSRYPLVVVSAAANCGKTTAVHDFAEEYQAKTAWLQFSERDNVAARFWDNFIHTMGQVDPQIVKAVSKLDFPDTEDSYRQFEVMVSKLLPALEKRILVFDDLHYLENSGVIRFMERLIAHASIGTTMILISRSTPPLNIAGLVSKGGVFNVTEKDLCFNENEVSQFLKRLEINSSTETLRDIMQDSQGWTFAINLIARTFLQAPGYSGYLRSAMKSSIFRLMETEAWDTMARRVQIFLVRLSLIGHLSFELIELLAGGDLDLIQEMEKQNIYMRRDTYIHAYVIQPLFLEFLAAKQHLLSQEDIKETYTIAGRWCNKNGFKIDALSYYEKLGDYETIIDLWYDYPGQIPYDIANYCIAICERAAPEAFNSVMFLAITHVRCYMRTGQWEKAEELFDLYEQKFLKLPKTNTFRIINLGGLYLLKSYMRICMGLLDGVFDFDSYLAKFISDSKTPQLLSNHYSRVRFLGPWANANSSSKKGAPEEYIKAVERASVYMPGAFSGFMGGEEELVKGELKFFQADLIEADSWINQAIQKSREHRQYEIFNRAQHYSMRLGLAQGNFPRVEQALKEMKAQLEDEDYGNRFLNYDIAQAIYYYAMGEVDQIPDWFKEEMSPYYHASYIENFENLVKARYCYLCRNYPPILSYLEDMKQRESYLYGRLSMLALGACVHHKMKNKDLAHSTLREAYETAEPNNLIMPFIELGKDMRTLSACAMKSKVAGIAPDWLELINRKSASYAKRRVQVSAAFRMAHGIEDTVYLSPKESEILTDLSHGLSRAEIAINRNLSVNTIKMLINRIFSRLGAGNTPDLIRIAKERAIL
ncbi:MAG: LuxR C-terminal-related transcriptional regulator [Treponema sp.]|nr:LuxR C-terminal-related transcriptional regulator [Treponema sp.]